ncbi:MAG: hypothetical protein ACD_42C00126G0002, partial [uncultured bacterium]
RRCGWFDAVLMRRAVVVNSLSSMALMKLDVLDTLSEIKIGNSYRYRGKVIHDLPVDLCDLQACEPIYETMPGWQSSTFGITEFEKLPLAAKNYLAQLEKLCGVPIEIISTGPERNQTIFLND